MYIKVLLTLLKYSILITFIVVLLRMDLDVYEKGYSWKFQCSINFYPGKNLCKNNEWYHGLS